MTKRGEYGRGSIRQRGNRWQIRYRVDDVNEDGERVRRGVTESFRTKAEARKRLNSVVAAISEGRYQGPSADRLNFTDLERMVLDHLDRRGRHSSGSGKRSASTYALISASTRLRISQPTP